MLQRSDPFRTEKCDRQSCMVCQTSGKGSCDKEGVTYSIRCVECAGRGIEKVYYGESSRNAYSRGEEHLDEYRRKTKDSVLWRHCRLDHESEIQNFTMSVTGIYRRDAMLRQVSEAVALGNAKVGTIINTKKEWNYVQLPKVVVDNGEYSD